VSAHFTLEKQTGDLAITSPYSSDTLLITVIPMSYNNVSFFLPFGTPPAMHRVMLSQVQIKKRDPKRIRKMKRMLSIWLAFGFALGIVTSSFAMGVGPPNCPYGLLSHLPGLPPQAQRPPFEALGCIGVDGQLFSVPVTPAGKQSTIGTPGSPHVISTPGFEITIEGLFDPDPLISYMITVQDLGAPSSFTFAFSTPLIPLIDGPNTVSGDITTTMFDFGGGGTISFTPGFTNFAVSSVSADGGSTLQNMGVDVGPGTSTGLLAGPAPSPGLPWNYMETIISFDMGGGGDFAFVSGNTIIEFDPDPMTVPSPEPGTLLLLGSGLAVFGIVVRRRKRRETTR